MRLHCGRYECALCGAVLDIPLIPDPMVMIKASSRRPRMRALILFGETIHECALDRKPHQRLLDRDADSST